MSYHMLENQVERMELSYVLFYFGKHWIVISDSVASIQIASCIVDPFNYALFVAVHHYLPLALEDDRVYLKVVAEKSDDCGHAIGFGHTRVCLIMVARNIALASP